MGDAIHLDRAVQRVAQTLVQRRYLLLTELVGEHGELRALKAVDRAVASDGVAQALADATQRLVAAAVAVVLVHLVQPPDAQQHDRLRAFL